MQVKEYVPATISGRELIMEGTDMRVQILTLDEGESIPWHFHSEISDYFVCLEGTLVVETKAPSNKYFLEVGERCSVPPMNAHYVHGLEMSKAKFLILQGVGVYDNIPVGANKLSYQHRTQEQDDRE